VLCKYFGKFLRYVAACRRTVFVAKSRKTFVQTLSQFRTIPPSALRLTDKH